MDRTWYTYIMASRTRVLYTGMTNNLRARVFQHRNGEGGFTAKYRCHRLVWFERHSSPGSAIALEKQIKGWLRSRKLALIEQQNPTWADLSEGWGI